MGEDARYKRAFAIARRHDRLVGLIRSGVYSSRGLAKKLGVSEQTIYRDIDSLRQRGFSIRAEKHPDHWAYHLVAEPTPIAGGREASHR